MPLTQDDPLPDAWVWALRVREMACEKDPAVRTRLLTKMGGGGGGGEGGGGIEVLQTHEEAVWATVAETVQEAYQWYAARTEWEENEMEEGEEGEEEEEGDEGDYGEEGEEGEEGETKGEEDGAATAATATEEAEAAGGAVTAVEEVEELGSFAMFERTAYAAATDLMGETMRRFMELQG